MKKVTILSLDGGGIRGLFPVLFCVICKNFCNRKIIQGNPLNINYEISYFFIPDSLEFINNFAALCQKLFQNRKLLLFIHLAAS